MTSGNASRPYLSRLRSRTTEHAPLSSLTALGLALMEERRWSPLRTTGDGSVLDMELREMRAWHQARYGVLKAALLALLELQELKPEDPD
jgi:hypothetical protein